MRQFKINNGDIFSMNQALFFGIKLTTIGDNEWVYGSFAKHATLQFGSVSSSILIFQHSHPMNKLSLQILAFYSSKSKYQ